ncbi:MAG: hypothetical protein ACRCSF_00520 [Mycobacteriaceae bacterium]
MSAHIMKPPTSVRWVAVQLLLPVLLGAIVALIFLGAFHKPAATAVRVDVVGTSDQVKVLALDLQNVLGDSVSIRSVDTEARAKAKLQLREIAAAYLPDPVRPRLLVSTAASDSVATYVQRMFNVVVDNANKTGTGWGGQATLAVEDVIPADANDPTGISLFYILIALTIGAIGSGVVIASVGGEHAMRSRAALAAGTSVVLATVVTGISSLLYSAISGEGLVIGVLSFIYVLAVILWGVGLQSIFGKAALVGEIVVFVVLGFAVSGGLVAPSLQSGFFSTLHNFWPTAAFIEAGRNAMYFPKVSFESDLLVLSFWVCGGCALVIVASRLELFKRRSTGPLTTATSDRIDRPLEVAPAVEPVSLLTEKEQVQEAEEVKTLSIPAHRAARSSGGVSEWSTSEDPA